MENDKYDLVELNKIVDDLKAARAENVRLRTKNDMLFKILMRTEAGKRMSDFADIILSDDETFEAWLNEEVLK